MSGETGPRGPHPPAGRQCACSFWLSASAPWATAGHRADLAKEISL